jgi:hypothetical protein
MIPPKRKSGNKDRQVDRKRERDTQREKAGGRDIA